MPPIQEPFSAKTHDPAISTPHLIPGDTISPKTPRALRASAFLPSASTHRRPHQSRGSNLSSSKASRFDLTCQDHRGNFQFIMSVVRSDEQVPWFERIIAMHKIQLNEALRTSSTLSLVQNQRRRYIFHQQQSHPFNLVCSRIRVTTQVLNNVGRICC
jgi:hypothetical protein